MRTCRKTAKADGLPGKPVELKFLEFFYRACLEYQALDAGQAGDVYKERCRSLVIMMWPRSTRMTRTFAPNERLSENSTVTFSVEMQDSRVGGLHILRYFSDIVVAVCGNRNRSRDS